MKQVLERVESDLRTDILVKKREMIQKGLKYGLTDNRTVKCSQELDRLLNRYANRII